MQCFYANEGKLPDAVRALNEKWNNKFSPGSPEYIEDPYGFIKDNVHKLETRFTLLDIKPSGRPPIFPDGVAKECAVLLSSGYWQTRFTFEGGGPVEHQEWCRFTSLRDAISHLPRLQQVMHDYGVDAQQLLKRMEQVVPQLHYGPVPMKVALSDATKQQRVNYCTNMLHNLRANPDFLLDVYMMDECRIWVGQDLITKRLKVWSMRGDMEGQPPLSNVLFDKNKSFKINLVLVVNPRHGAVWWEYCSGTDCMAAGDRRNPEMSTLLSQKHDGPIYKVRYRNSM